MIGVCLLGATGSIGDSTLDVIARHADNYRIIALTANAQVPKMVKLCQQFEPDYAVMASEPAAEILQQQLKSLSLSTQVLSGTAGLEHVAALPSVDYVMAAIVGAAGLLPTLAAARAGKRILLANKEALVMSGRLFMDEIQRSGAELLPIDSEHNAIFQSMPVDFSRGLAASGVRRILLTASGGPFRTKSLDQLQHVTPEQAIAHPNWVMGRKISVDSASMMNKGLELIEACWLFDAKPSQVQIVVHPESMIHSMVEYVDGSVISQMGNPDMRIPIAHAMAWPKRMASGDKGMNIFEVAQLNFEKADEQRFPCLRLAREAIEAGGTLPTVLNAANEVAVEAFLESGLPFLAIPQVIEKTLEESTHKKARSLEVIFDEDREARVLATQFVRQLG
ncbi:MAG: 1-deoxy-D-xylulose-5-phosphate reductoisomerase [Gammaproteobacteria bacterium]|nr:1-deoxy-D-xylulose-5-phosphate reductoisomerase [Gammaproteobacteria bacterium]MCF6229821.1 1-deoxy-D-xylulose-5-phosphate reductoisomerase [Gammaproteobacteria bacterium]